MPNIPINVKLINGKPVNPATGKPYTSEELREEYDRLFPPVEGAVKAAQPAVEKEKQAGPVAVKPKIKAEGGTK